MSAQPVPPPDPPQGPPQGPPESCLPLPSPGRLKVPSRRFRPHPTLDEWEVLDALCKSGLADIPRPLITEEQLEAVLKGWRVEPTLAQRQAALRIWSGAAEPRSFKSTQRSK